MRTFGKGGERKDGENKGPKRRRANCPYTTPGLTADAQRQPQKKLSKGRQKQLKKNPPKAEPRLLDPHWEEPKKNYL